MPNHVTHRVIITGPAAAIVAFKAAHIREADGEMRFDFETLIPMPEVLRGSNSGSNESMGYELITGKVWPERLGFQRSVLTYPWVQELGVKTIDELNQHFLKTEPERHAELMQAGAAAVRCIEESGYASWYEWSIANWGTKWNAYDFDVVADLPDHFEFRFNTAWSPPVPIFEKLAELYPTLKIEADAFDEGWNFAWHATAENGELEESDQEATDEMYEQVYGSKPERDDDDEEESETNGAHA